MKINSIALNITETEKQYHQYLDQGLHSLTDKEQSSKTIRKSMRPEGLSANRMWSNISLMVVVETSKHHHGNKQSSSKQLLNRSH